MWLHNKCQESIKPGSQSWGKTTTAEVPSGSGCRWVNPGMEHARRAKIHYPLIQVKTTPKVGQHHKRLLQHQLLTLPKRGSVILHALAPGSPSAISSWVEPKLWKPSPSAGIPALLTDIFIYLLMYVHKIQSWLSPEEVGVVPRNA